MAPGCRRQLLQLCTHLCAVQLLGCLYKDAASLHIADGRKEHELRPDTEASARMTGKLSCSLASFLAHTTRLPNAFA